MTKQSEDKPPAVPRVDLLEPAVEPTDAELEALMRDMMRTVREKHDKTVQARRDLDLLGPARGERE